MCIRDSAKPLICSGNPLGHPKFVLGTKEFDIESGERVMLYTDGIIEVENESGKQYGMKRLAKYLTDSKNVQLPTILEDLVKSLEDYSADEIQEDDWTFLVLEKSDVAATQQAESDC